MRTCRERRPRSRSRAGSSAEGACSAAPTTRRSRRRCLDAETLAAWMDGGLDAQSVAMAEAHAVELRPVPGPDRHAGTRHARGGGDAVRARCACGDGGLRRWPPAAAAVTLWMVVPNDRYTAPTQPKEIAAEPRPNRHRAQARDAAAPAIPAAPAARSRVSQKNAPAAGKDQQIGTSWPIVRRGPTPRGNTAAFDDQSARPKH